MFKAISYLYIPSGQKFGLENLFSTKCFKLFLNLVSVFYWIIWKNGILDLKLIILEQNWLLGGLAQSVETPIRILRNPNSKLGGGKKNSIQNSTSPLEYFWAKFSQVWVRTWWTRVIISLFNCEIVTTGDLC